MLLSEVVFHLVTHLNWRNILLLNANEDASACLLRMLNDNGIPALVVEYTEMMGYSWPERLNPKPRMDGYVFLATQQANFTGILGFLKKKHLLVPFHKWIIGVEGSFRLSDFSPLFKEGDCVFVVAKNKEESHWSCPRLKRDLIYQETSKEMYEGIGMWTLRSPGNGSFYFEDRRFTNYSSLHSLFDEPFRNFQGRTLRISSLASPPIRIAPENDEGRWDGYIFQIVNTLADFLNFSYTVKEADNRLYGMEQQDGSWSGMIGELMRKSVDLGVGDLSWTLDRFLVVDLTMPVFPETVTFIYAAPDYYSRTWILFQGIQAEVWIAMMSATVAAFVAYFLSLSMHQLERHYMKDDATMYIESADESISTLYRGLLGKGVMKVPESMSSRTVLAAWFVGSLILSALYGGSLTSKLSLHKSPKPADSLKELLKRHPDAILAVRNNSQIHQFFKNSAYWNKVWMKNMKNYVIPGQFHISDTMLRVHNSSNGKTPYCWIAERSMLVKMMHQYSDNSIVCDLYVAKESIGRSDWSIALQRDSPFLAQFNEMINRMKHFGLLERWRRAYWEAASGSCHPSDGLNQSGETPITMEDTWAIFIVLAIGWSVGIAALLIEVLYCNRSSC